VSKTEINLPVSDARQEQQRVAQDLSEYKFGWADRDDSYSFTSERGLSRDTVAAISERYGLATTSEAELLAVVDALNDDPRIHGILDYLVGVVLIAAPWLFGFADGSAAMWVPIIIGVGAILYAFLTDYELGVIRIIPMNVHLAIDVIGGIVLAVSPWLFGFADVVWIPHVVVGLIAVGAGLTTERRVRGKPIID
jgi:hypothetical protein